MKIKTKMTALVAGVGLALGASTVQAQTSTSTSHTSHGSMSTAGTHHFHFRPGFGSGMYGGGDYGSYFDPATNPLQGIAYGYARLLQSSGEGAKAGAEAALTLSEVQNREMDNWKKALETTLAVEKINRDARIAARGRPLTPADYVRLAQMGKPRRLTPSQLNLMTGELAWPVVLESTAFESYRQVLDGLFAERTEHGRLGAEEYAQAQETAQAMTDLLRQRIAALAPADYMAARRFLESVAYELRMPTTEGEEMRTAALLRPLR
ncbi:MAG: hypothetical protein ABSG86_28900 [Thermoguttaceae bacterium]